MQDRVERYVKLPTGRLRTVTFVTRLSRAIQYTRRKESAMTTELTRFLRDESGTAAIEYGLIAASISIAIITAVQSLGLKLKVVFVAMQSAFN